MPKNFEDYDYKLSELIGIYPNAVDKKICQKIIDEFESPRYKKAVINDPRKQTIELEMFNCNGSPMEECTIAVEKAVHQYSVQYEKDIKNKFPEGYEPLQPYLLVSGRTGIEGLQIQNYPVGSGGYMPVHIEQIGAECCKRIYSVIIYLNDIDGDGETSFPLAGMKVKPRAGTLLIHPAGTPFYHKGEKCSQEKYIITAWIVYAIEVSYYENKNIETRDKVTI